MHDLAAAFRRRTTVIDISGPLAQGDHLPQPDMDGQTSILHRCRVRHLVRLARGPSTSASGDHHHVETGGPAATAQSNDFAPSEYLHSSRWLVICDDLSAAGDRATRRELYADYIVVATGFSSDALDMAAEVRSGGDDGNSRDAYH